jgi:hypothetical protein
MLHQSLIITKIFDEIETDQFLLGLLHTLWLHSLYAFSDAPMTLSYLHKSSLHRHK